MKKKNCHSTTDLIKEVFITFLYRSVENRQEKERQLLLTQITKVEQLLVICSSLLSIKHMPVILNTGMQNLNKGFAIYANFAW